MFIKYFERYTLSEFHDFLLFSLSRKYNNNLFDVDYEDVQMMTKLTLCGVFLLLIVYGLGGCIEEQQYLSFPEEGPAEFTPDEITVATHWQEGSTQDDNFQTQIKPGFYHNIPETASKYSISYWIEMEVTNPYDTVVEEIVIHLFFYDSQDTLIFEKEETAEARLNPGETGFFNIVTNKYLEEFYSESDFDLVNYLEVFVYSFG